MRHAILPPAVPRLQTPRLVLRALDPGDADDIFAYAADPEVAQYTLALCKSNLHRRGRRMGDGTRCPFHKFMTSGVVARLYGLEA